MFRFTNLVILELTRDCNLRCEYCLMTDKQSFKGEVLDFDLFKKIINKMIQERLLSNNPFDDFTLVFHGGEAFLVGKDYIKYAEYAYKMFNFYNIPLYLGTQTNGTLLQNTSILRFLRKDGFSVGVSFDGFENSNAYRIKNSEQSDSYYTKLFQTLKENNIPFGIISVVHNKNIDHLDNVEKFVEDAHSKNFNYTYLPVEDPKGKGNFEVYDQLFEKVYKRQIDKFVINKQVDVKFTKKIEMTLYDLVAHHKGLYRSGCFGKICGSAIGMISVRPDGKCGYCDRFIKEMDYNFIKNAIDFDFLAIHQLKKAIDFAAIKHTCLLKSGCDSCRAGYMCDYGCLAFTYSAKNKFEIEKDRVCNINLKVYDYIKENFIPFATLLAENNVKIHFMETFFSFKQDILDLLKKNNLKITLDPKNLFFMFQKIQKEGEEKDGI